MTLFCIVLLKWHKTFIFKMDENLNKGIKRIGKEREQQRNGRKNPLKHVKRPLTHKSKNINMLEKILSLKFREMVYREVRDPFYEISFDIRYLTVQLNEDLNTTRHTTLKVLYITTPYNCTNSTDN